MPAAPRAGVHYPRSMGEFSAWFATDADCLDYLEWLRWPAGFACLECDHAGGWRLGDGRWMCSGCGARTSSTAGTIKRSLEIGSYQTAWAMLHRVRSVLVRPGRERLQGTVEVDETFFGGEEPGLRGGRAHGKKSLVGVAVERARPRGFGRCRMALLADASADSLRGFLVDHVQEGATIITDGWPSYPAATRELYVHDRLIAPRADATRLLPGVHTVASLAKRWLLGTHQGAVDDAHLAGYLNEFVFRFNRRRSRSRGLVFYRVLELAATHDPVRYRDLIAHPRPATGPRLAPSTRGRPASLERPPANRPWRAIDPA